MAQHLISLFYPVEILSDFSSATYHSIHVQTN